MRVLVWINSGFLEDLARVATKDETNLDVVHIVTNSEQAVELLTNGDIDIVLLGKGRLCEWSRLWREGAFHSAPAFRCMLLSTMPASTATLLEAREVGIFDVADLTMSRDDIGHRMLGLFAQLDTHHSNHNAIVDKRLQDYQLLQDISDETDRRILMMIAEGKFDKEISREMFLSLQTIRNRISRMLTESGARNRTHLAMMFTSESTMLQKLQDNQANHQVA